MAPSNKEIANDQSELSRRVGTLETSVGSLTSSRERQKEINLNFRGGIAGNSESIRILGTAQNKTALEVANRHLKIVIWVLGVLMGIGGLAIGLYSAFS